MIFSASRGPDFRPGRTGRIFGIAFDPFDEQVEHAAKRGILFYETRFEAGDLRLKHFDLGFVDRRLRGGTTTMC